jgi:hypothetical protein
MLLHTDNNVVIHPQNKIKSKYALRLIYLASGDATLSQEYR